MFSDKSFLWFTALCILFAGVIPVLLVLFWSRNIIKKDADIPEREDRPLLLVLVIISYLTGTAALYFLNAPWLVSGLMFCYCTNTFVVLLINFFWKISIHSMGVAGPTTALVFAIGPSGLLFGILLLPVMWSRVHLHRHTAAQVLAGAGLGFLLTAVQLLLIGSFSG